jgi:nucleoside-diphosphate-sugar epimerase
MAILITGSTGYIGSKLTIRLAEQGQKIHLLCRSNPHIAEFQKPNIRIFSGDISDTASIEAAMEGVDQVYHLAAYARLWAKDPATFFNINVKGTENVFAAAKKSGVKKIVYTSTAGVIGPSKEKPMSETDPRITGFFNPYEETKSRAEGIALDYAAQGLEIVILNPSRIYGPGFDTGSNPVTKIVELYVKGKWKVIPGNGADLGSYCYIDDVVDGHIAAMHKGRSGERYIFGGVNASFNQLMDLIKKYSGVERKLWHIPFPFLSGMSRMMLMYAGITGKPPMITPDWVRKYYYDWALDSTKAEKELGYQIRPLELGIKETVDWVKQNRL